MSLLLTICLLHCVAQLSPGPDVLIIAKNAASNSRINTLKIIAGISTGIMLWVILTLSGFSILVETMPWIQQVIMLFGAIFLAKMGMTMLKGGLKSLKAGQIFEINAELNQPSQHYYLMGLMINLSNPKVLIYFSSVFSLALSSGASPNLKTQLAFIIPIQTFLVFTILMLILSLPKIKVMYQRAGNYIDIISGALFMLFALFLIWDAISLFAG